MDIVRDAEEVNSLPCALRCL